MEAGSASSSSPDSPRGLKFVKKIYPERVGDVRAHPKSATGSLPVTGVGQPFPAPLTVKKGRGRLVQGRRCQVEGCETDLSDVKAYYSRHKVCATHSKSPMAIVAGLEQRFCQQCSRSGCFLVDFTAYPNLAEGTWLNTRTFERGWNNQTTVSGKFLQSPWLKSSENSTSDLMLQGSAGRTSYSGPGIPSGNCFPGVSDSSGALSLLSNESWGSRNQPSSLGVDSLDTDGGSNIQPSGSHAAHINHYPDSQWGFKGNEGSSSSHNMPPNLGLGQISHHAFNQYSAGIGMTQHSGKQFMELEQSKGYDSSVQNVNWTL
ncbi:unnamed protein product [Withania somnifera]